MTRVFLSYASPNSAVAAQLTREWRERRVEVFRFGDPAQQGDIIIDQIEREIRDADVFVALMSPEYLASPWCRRELRLAIESENRSGGRFVYVVEVSRTRPEDAGMLGSYSWVDAKGDLTGGRLDAITEALSFGRRPTGSDAEFPGFRNREDELNALLGALQTLGGRDLWVVVSAPLMGKTWLLAKLEKALVNATPSWSVHRMDLRREPTELRSNPARLVTALLQVDDIAQDSLAERNLQAIAVKVGARLGPLLFMLDSAELLTPHCATVARAALTAVHRMVRQTGRTDRCGMLIATRRHDEWRGLGPDARTGQRFDALALSEFGHAVVHQALIDLRRNLGGDQLWSYAARLQRLSEGLPALLVRSVQWGETTGFLQMEESDGPDAFDAVARDYVQKDLLSADSLLPMGAARPEAALVVLRSTLRVLSTYRLYTQSHLKFHLDADPALRRALEDAGWTHVDLWEALGRTALQSQQKAAQEIWHEIEPSLRRLLHRYHHPSGAERSVAHATACQFYSGWTRNTAAGREQQVVLVECLWHEASRLTIEEPHALAATLPSVAARLARGSGASPMFQPEELRDAVFRRLSDDDDLRVLLAGDDGLFDAIVDTVMDVIGVEE